MLKKIIRFFYKKPNSEAQMLKTLHEYVEQKTIDHDSMTMIEGVLNVSKIQVRDTMIPRAQMVILNVEQSLEEITKIIIESKHSRFPVICENKDNIIGFLLAKDLLINFQKPKESFDIKTAIRPAIFVPESKKLDNLLHEFQVKHSHMAIVIDEYGNVAGLVTIEDVLEKIVGDIEDEDFTDTESPTITKENNKYTILANTIIEQLNDELDLKLKNSDFDTIGGHIAAEIGHMPKSGCKIIINDYEFTVIKSSPKKILLLEATKC
ncbi:MAG: CBS domain-containing protein [Legionellales bacterium]|nr:CBS domain-containing protein [Legionellales bacterium]